MAPFAQITQGPASTTGKNTNQQALVLDEQNVIVSAVGTAGLEQALETAILILGVQTALATITTAQTLFSIALPAGALNKLNRRLRIRASLIYTSPGTTTPTLTIAIVLGTITLCTITTAALSATASTNMPVVFEFILNTAVTGSSGQLQAHGNVKANISANAPAGAIAEYLDTNTALTTAENLQSALTLKATIAASGTITSAQLLDASVEVVN